MTGWSVEMIEARVDELRLEHEGDAFVAAVAQFSREELDRRGRKVLYDVLIARANIKGAIADAARERRQQGWIRRMLGGQVVRRPRRGV
jgi:hypothetical protein